MGKRSLRKEAFARLRDIPAPEKELKSFAISIFLEAEPAFQKAHTVFSYLALSSEPDLGQLVKRYPDKKWAFSRVSTEGEHLSFHHVTSSKQLSEGPFGFLEPDPNSCPVLESADLILVPGVGFDRSNGARLGRGKGHYDRYLGPMREAETCPPLIGICFSTQLISLSPEAHDVAMDKIVSEDGWDD